MQGKLIDYASDKIAKKLSTVKKEDVKKIMTNVKGRMKSRAPLAPPINSRNLLIASNGTKSPEVDGITSSEEYCKMLKDEFVFTPMEVVKPRVEIKFEKQESVKLIDTPYESEGKILHTIDFIFKD